MASRPLKGAVIIAQEYGIKNKGYRRGFHTGVDYATSIGRAVYAPSTGRVEFGDGRAESDGRGYFAIVYGDDGISHHLYHLSAFGRPAGRVKEGELIGYTGNTGKSTGPHLHWETRRAPYGGENDFNPADWLYKVVPASNKEEDMCTLHMLNLIFDYRFGEPPDQKAIDTFVGKKTPDEVDKHVIGTKRYKDHVKALSAAMKALKGHLPNEVKG